MSVVLIISFLFLFKKIYAYSRIFSSVTVLQKNQPIRFRNCNINNCSVHISNFEFIKKIQDKLSYEKNRIKTDIHASFKVILSCRI